MPSLVRTSAVGLLVAAFLVVGGGARATTFSASELSQDNALLNQFNLVALGNLTQGAGATSSSIQGRAIVGGNATFTNAASVCSTNCTGNSSGSVDSSGATYGALTVFGNVVAPTGTTNALSTTAGDVNVKGTSSGNYSLNNAGRFNEVGVAAAAGTANATNVVNATAIRTTQSTFAGASYATTNGTTFTAGTTPQGNQTLASVFPFTSAYQTSVKALAQGIANLPGTPGVTAQALPSGNNVFFTALNDFTAGGKKYGVVTTTLANLASETNFQGINNGTNDATFVIVTGDGANYLLPNLNSANEGKVIFDFVDATTLRFAGGFSGTILAPLATITQQGGSFNGSVVIASLNQSQSLTDGALFSGDLSGLVGLTSSARVPEPASLLLLGVGLGAAAWTRRRRK